MKKFLILLLPILLTACGGSDEVQSEPKNSGKTLEETMERYKANQQIEAEATAKNDSDICDQIDDDGQKYSCRFNILAKEASRKKDPSICKKIGEPTAIRICEEDAAAE